MTKLAIPVALVIVAIVLYILFRGDTEVTAEGKYDGVHLCTPSQQTAEAAIGAPPPTPTLTPTRTATATQPPEPGTTPQVPEPGTATRSKLLFAQNDPKWGAEEYDHGREQDVGCGKTLAECGCAMTSVATVLSLFDIITTPGGAELSPSSMNAWFNQGAKLTNAGWVSQGYVYGNVVWTAANNFKGPQTDPSQPPLAVRFAGWGSGSEAEVRRELSAGRPVVLEVPGHYIAAVGLQGDQILINDPYYANRTTLSSYAGRVKSSRLYEPSQDRRAIMVTVPGGQRVQVTDARGNVVGTLSSGDPADVVNGAKKDLPGSSYRFEEQWRDPTCTERPPEEGAGVNMVYIPLPENGTYRVRVLNPGGSSTAVAVHMYDVNGDVTMQTHEGGKDEGFDIVYGGGTVQPTTTPTPLPAETATPVLSVTPTQQAPTSTATAPTLTPVPPTVTPVPPTATPTRVPPTATATPGPVSKISLSIAPSPITCNGANATQATVVLTDASGGPAATTRIRFTISPEVATIPDVTVTNGRATVPIVPVGHAGPTYVTAFVVPGVANTNSPPAANAQFTCIFVNN
ncbi:MAG: C39 family peptidase [Dehalococcoidia bacterium]